MQHCNNCELVGILQCLKGLSFGILLKKFISLQSIKPICLLQEPSNNADKYDGRLVTLIGWGSSTNFDGKPSARLRNVDIQIYSQR
jgi:hypothetical protein